ncbi:MAG: lactate racemase domain-containing protein [Candidatus Hodarchaeota archaeon]
MTDREVYTFYGDKKVTFPDFSGEILLLEPQPFQKTFKDWKDEFKRVISNPINSEPLAALLNGNYSAGSSIVIIVDDYTRPNIHTRIILPFLLQTLIELDVQKQDLKILLATGSHRAATGEEIVFCVGEKVANEYKGQIFSHDYTAGNKVFGHTKNGTPIDINHMAVEACLIIPLTDSELHYFAGVAGTIKSITPGISSRTTIQLNHSKIFDKKIGFHPGCRLGNVKGNPVITEFKEIVRVLSSKIPIFGIDCIVANNEIVYLAAGNLINLHDQAIDIITRIRSITVKEPADLVIVNPGILGINLYQSGKGTHAAWNAARKPGGSILCLAPCPDGVGNEAYAKTMDAIKDFSVQEALEHVIDHYCGPETFKIGNQKPVDLLRIIKTLGEDHLFVMTEMDAKTLYDVFRMNKVDPADDPSTAFQEFIRNFVVNHHKPETELKIYIINDPGLNVQIKVEN